MKLVVVGGHSRNIGKTAVAAAVIRATRELDWMALKLTQYGHHMCAVDGRTCECAPDNPEHPFTITREDDPNGGSDTSRFLAAGAGESWWVRVAMGRLPDALPAIRALISGRPYVAMESNSVLRFLRPDLYLVVLDWDVADFKTSARENLDRADAFVQLETSRTAPAWEEVPLGLIERRPVFRVRRGEYWNEPLENFVRGRLAQRPRVRLP